MKDNYLSFLDSYKNLLGSIEGLPEDQIDSIEVHFKVKLPKAYRDYLLSFGKESGNILSSYYTEYPSVIENKGDAIYAINFDETKRIEDKPIVKDKYFFFAQWQGYNFFFFDCGIDNENPPVYLLTDAPEIKKYKDSFTDFIRDEGLQPLLVV